MRLIFKKPQSSTCQLSVVPPEADQLSVVKVVEIIETVKIDQSSRSRLKAAPTDESYGCFLSPVSWILTSGSLLYALCIFATDDGPRTTDAFCQLQLAESYISTPATGV